MFSVKTPHGTQLRFITSSLTIKQQWLTWDHWACTFKIGPKDSDGFKKHLSFMAPFYGWGSTASRLEPLWESSLIYKPKSPVIPGTHFINLRRIKGWYVE